MKNEAEWITKKQRQFLDDFVDFISINKYIPTIRELCAYTGLKSPATIKYYLGLLEKKGYIQRINNRCIKIVGEKE